MTQDTATPAQDRRRSDPQTYAAWVRACALAPSIFKLRTAGARSRRQLAAALTAHGVPRPSGAGPWHPHSVARVLHRLASPPPPMPAPRRTERRRARTRAERELRDTLRDLALNATRVQLLGPAACWTAAAERSRGAVAGILACRPWLRDRAEDVVRELAPEIGQAVMREAQQQRRPVPALKIACGPAPRWHLHELLGEGAA